MGDFTHAENTERHHIYGHANRDGRAALRMYHAQFFDRRMPDHRIFQQLHRQLRETRSFPVSRHDIGRRRAVLCASLIFDSGMKKVLLNGRSIADLSSFRALGAEDLQTPWALEDRNLYPENLVKSSLSSAPQVLNGKHSYLPYFKRRAPCRKKVGYVKSLAYADKPQTLDHLEDNIRRVIADIRPQMLEKVIENWTSRLDYIRASRYARNHI
ncbi:hypothetical protein TNCV_859701 [Trichonephila clavipes]|nr:hypothetical protein TNCV_859701 [Trichonephila clavipes]